MDHQPSGLSIVMKEEKFGFDMHPVQPEPQPDVGPAQPTSTKSYWTPLQRFATKVEKLLGFETRGIVRVTEAERSPQSYWGLCLIW
jgi:hypothetical protein